MSWSFFINEREVFPMNQRELKEKISLTDDILHAYRKNTSYTLILQNRRDLGTTDYDYIKSLETTHRFDKLTFTVYHDSALWSSYEFTINNIVFDDYKAVCSIEVTIRDIYTEIQENEDI